jgi:hypothetical protein
MIALGLNRFLSRHLFPRCNDPTVELIEQEIPA